MKKKRYDKSVVTTVAGVIMPASKEETSAIHGLMAQLGSAKRMAFNCRVKDGIYGRGAIEDYIQNLLPSFDTRFVRDAITDSATIIESQQALLPAYLAATQKRLEKTVEKLFLYWKGERRPRRPLDEVLRGIGKRIEKLERRIEQLEWHISRGTIPAIVFGGKANLRRRQKGLITTEEWKAVRSNSFYSRGDASKKGNLHTRIYYNEEKDAFTVRIAIPQDKGNCRYLFCPLMVAPAKRHKLRRELLIGAVENEQPYSVRVIRCGDRIETHITLEKEVYGGFVKDIPATVSKVGGIDLNVDRVAVTLSDRKGNFLKRKTFYCHNLEHVRTGQRDFTINQVVKEMFEWLLAEGVGALVIERLDFKQDLDPNAKVNRFRSNFAYSKLHNAITRKALRKGLFIRQVNPAFTSQIGALKYAEQYGLARHEAAAYVIGRRGLQFEERIPKSIIRQMPEIIEGLSQKAAGAKEAARKKLFSQIGVLNSWKACSPVNTKHKWKLWPLLYKSLPCPVIPTEGTAGISGRSSPLTGACPSTSQ